MGIGVQALEGPAVSSISNVGLDHGSIRVRDRLNHLDSLPDIRKRRDERALDKDEEDYFNEDRWVWNSLVNIPFLLLQNGCLCAVILELDWMPVGIVVEGVHIFMGTTAMKEVW